MMKCALCHKQILASQKYVRVIAEEVAKDEEDGGAVEQWSDIQDWRIFIAIHSDCIRKQISLDREFPYREEISQLDLVGMDGHVIPKLKVLDGGI